jgi:hypothetical protein
MSKNWRGAKHAPSRHLFTSDGGGDGGDAIGGGHGLDKVRRNKRMPAAPRGERPRSTLRFRRRESDRRGIEKQAARRPALRRDRLAEALKIGQGRGSTRPLCSFGRSHAVACENLFASRAQAGALHLKTLLNGTVIAEILAAKTRGVA